MSNSQRQLLVDEIRELEAKAAGKRMALCLDLGMRAEASAHMREMNAITTARIAARDAGCLAGGN